MNLIVTVAGINAVGTTSDCRSGRNTSPSRSVQRSWTIQRTPPTHALAVMICTPWTFCTRADALQTFRRCRDLLSIVLGVPPSGATQALFQQIRDNGG